MQRLVVGLVCLGAFPFQAFAQDEARLLRFPTIHGDSIVFSYAGNLYTVAASGGTARRLTSHEGYEMFARFSPDGKWLAIGSGAHDYARLAGRAHVVDLAEDKVVFSLDSRTYGIWDLAYSPDGKFIVGASGIYGSGMYGNGNGEVLIWDANSGADVQTLGGFPHCVYGIAVSRDSTRLASASGFLSSNKGVGLVKIWDLPTGSELVSLNDFIGCVHNVAFSADGKRLAVGADNNVYILGK